MALENKFVLKELVSQKPKKFSSIPFANVKVFTKQDTLRILLDDAHMKFFAWSGTSQTLHDEQYCCQVG